MRKSILLTFCLVIAACSVAQEDDKKKKVDPQFSVIGSLDFSGVSGESENDGLLVGGQFGVQVNVIDLSDLWSVRFGAEYSMQGGKSKTEYEGEPGMEPVSYESELRLNYLNFPIVSQYNSSSGFYAEAGLQPGILLSAKSKVNGYSSDSKDYLNKFDLGVVVGGGYKFKNNFGIGARVTPGLLNINKKQGNNDPPRDRNLVFGVRASYTF